MPCLTSTTGISVRARQDLAEMTLACRIEMLHERKGQPGSFRQMLEQLQERLQPARRSSDTDDRTEFIVLGLFRRRERLRAACPRGAFRVVR